MSLLSCGLPGGPVAHLVPSAQGLALESQRYSYEGGWALPQIAPSLVRETDAEVTEPVWPGPVWREEREYWSTAERAWQGDAGRSPCCLERGERMNRGNEVGEGRGSKQSRQLGYKLGNEKGHCSGLCHRSVSKTHHSCPCGASIPTGDGERT